MKKGQPGLSKGNGISGSESGRPAGYAGMSSAASKPFAESGGIDYSVQKWLLHSRGFPIDLFYLSIVVCGVGLFLVFPLLFSDVGMPFNYTLHPLFYTLPFFPCSPLFYHDYLLLFCKVLLLIERDGDSSRYPA